ncbi:hypothetical protein EV426DRAFT_539292 [Tirmania nivea]|nr:hypothetical protein EV426DRAFT_539292 [Tirmania nivea]
MLVRSLRDASGNSDGEHVITAADADIPLAIILDLLHAKKITLEKTPEPNTSTKLVGTDEWVEWFHTALSATDISAQTGQDSDINGFELVLDAAKLFPNANTPQLTFTTANFTKACVVSNLPIDLPLGVLESYSLIGFGFDAGKTGGPVTSDLSTVLKYVGVNLENNPIVEFLGSGVGLTLDATDGARNAIWFSPASSYSTVTRLQWKIDARGRIMEELKQILKGKFDIPVTGNANLVTRRTSTYSPGEGGNINVSTIPNVLLEVDLQIVGKKFPVTIDFQQDNNIRLQINYEEGNLLDSIIEWLQGSMESQEIPIVTWLKNVTAGILDALNFRRITIDVSNVENQRKITGFKIEVEVALLRGASQKNPAPILLTYSARPSKKGFKLRGELWLSTGGMENQNFLPQYEAATALGPITTTDIKYLDLSKLVPNTTIQPPKGIPTIVGRAFVEVTDTALTIGGDITCDPTALEPSDVPQISLESVTLDATYTFGTESSLDLSLGLQIDIHPPASATQQTPCTIKGSIKYDDGNWTLEATTTPLYGSALYQFFDPKAADETLTLLDKLEFGGLELVYKYSDGVGSEFKFSGAIYLGDLELDLDYNYTKEEWYFAASLSARTESSTLNTIIQSITGEENILPGFVGDIGIGDKNSPAIQLLCTKKSSKKKPEGASAADDDQYLIFSVSIGITLDGGKVPLRATFIQYRDLTWQKTVPPKRLLKFAVTGLPEIDVPAVGNLTQPFDEMFYMWLSSDTSTDPKDPIPGLTEDQVNLINASLDDPRGGNGVDKLIFKVNKKKPGANGGKPAAVILPGNHFVLVLKFQGKPEAILDYVFGGTSKPPPAPGSASRALTEKADTPSDSPGDDPSLVPMKKQAGAITISNIGFKYKNSSLSILLDASFEMGPLSFKLIGLKLILKFTEGKTLTNPPFPDFDIDGLAVGFNKPPLILAGMFIRLNTDEVKGYAGGIAVGFVPYLFKAAGFYGEVTPKEGGDFKSVFVFAKLEGPLITVGFAEISGITLGFGYNMSMRFPTAENVTSFPLLSGSNSFGDDLVRNFTTMLDVKVGGEPNPDAWFSIRRDSFWAAAGLKVAAFEILSVDAVIAVEWNPEVKIGIFGIAVADFPKGGSSSIKCHIELGISAVIDLGQGVMKLEAQLSPNSHLFDPNCRLTGGFALCYWFDGKYADKNLIGDWVFTVGGFHRAYAKPSHYPNPPRLGLSWDVGGAIKITGEAYFAITPKCCMFGGRLMATIVLGPLRAWFEAFADFLINYKPFYFMADGGISVGVSCKVDLLIVSFTIKVEIGAALHLEGPPLCGRVHVNFYIVAFDINFGPQPGELKGLDYRQFYMLVRQVETLPAATDEDGYDHVDSEAHLFSCIAGLLTDVKKPTTKPGDSWIVKGGIFGFQITSRVAISKAHQPVTQVLEDEPPEPGNILESKHPVYARPLKIADELTSELTIKIKRQKDDGGPRALMAEEEEIPKDIPGSWGIRPIHVSVPAAVWGPYSRDTDARASGNNSQALLNGDKSVVTEMMGVELGSPEPVIADDKIPKFSARESMESSVNPQGSEPEFKAFDNSNPNWAPADTQSPEERWKQVPEIWKSKGEQQKAVVKNWSAAMGWSPEDDFTDFGVPELLLEEERFLNRYLEAPMITVG